MAEYITKEEALNAVEDAMELTSSEYDMIAEKINNVPAVDVAPVKHGRWEETDLVELQGTTSETMRIPNMGLRCPACAHAFDKRLLWKDNSCPNCGAKMDGGEGK